MRIKSVTFEQSDGTVLVSRTCEETEDRKPIVRCRKSDTKGMLRSIKTCTNAAEAAGVVFDSFGYDQYSQAELDGVLAAIRGLFE